jgi:hypothetical protein
MLNHRSSNILLSLFLSAGGAAGGCAITYKLAGYDAALSFLRAGVLVVLALLAAQAILSIKSETRATYLVLFNIAFILGLVWFMSCLILPMFWVPAVDMSAKGLLALASVGLCSVNVYKGVALFKLKWTQVGGELLSRFYDKKRNSIEWQALVAELRMSVSIYIPGVSDKLNPFISVAIVISMLAGLSLRNAFPLFSLFAWGIQIIIVISLVMQMIGFAVGQFLEIAALEKKDGIAIVPV